jgi:hypothetical protein
MWFGISKAKDDTLKHTLRKNPLKKYNNQNSIHANINFENKKTL